MVSIYKSLERSVFWARGMERFIRAMGVRAGVRNPKRPRFPQGSKDSQRVSFQGVYEGSFKGIHKV